MDEGNRPERPKDGADTPPDGFGGGKGNIPEFNISGPGSMDGSGTPSTEFNMADKVNSFSGVTEKETPEKLQCVPR